MDNSDRPSRSASSSPVERATSFGSEPDPTGPSLERPNAEGASAADVSRSETGGNKTYEVGYKRPPVNTRFQKGHPGHKRRKVSVATATDFRLEVLEALGELVTVTENGRTYQTPAADAIARTFSHSIVRGDARARTALMRIIEWSDRASDRAARAGAAERRCFLTIMHEFVADINDELYRILCDLHTDRSEYLRWRKGLENGHPRITLEVWLMAVMNAPRGSLHEYFARLPDGAANNRRV